MSIAILLAFHMSVNLEDSNHGVDEEREGEGVQEKWPDVIEMQESQSQLFLDGLATLSCSGAVEISSACEPEPWNWLRCLS